MYARMAALRRAVMQGKLPLAVCVAAILLFGWVSAFASNGPSTWWDGSPWRNDERGFHWYPDPNQPKDEQEAEPPAPAPPSYKEMKTLEEVRKEIERLKNIAILDPTEANVLTWLEANNWVMDKSSVFADTARRVAWANPQVDYNNRQTTVNTALSDYRSGRREDFKENIANLSANHGIFFFYRSDCRFCHQQAPILKLLEAKYGIKVMAISMDGGPIPNFADAVPDNGISYVVSGGQGVTTVPAIFLVKRETRESVPIGTGVLAAEEIVERIWILTQTKPGDEF